MQPSSHQRHTSARRVIDLGNCREHLRSQIAISNTRLCSVYEDSDGTAVVFRKGGRGEGNPTPYNLRILRGQ